MAIIDTRTWKIFQGTDIDEVDKNSFECDDIIAPAIRILNQKGYFTQGCCAGHPYAMNIELVGCMHFHNNAYIEFKHEIGTIPEGWNVDDKDKSAIIVSLETTDLMDFFTKQLEAMKNLYKWAVKLPCKD